MKRTIAGVAVTAALLATLGCAGEGRNVLPHNQSVATAKSPAVTSTATVTAHISNCVDKDSDGNPIVDCFVEFVPVGPDGKYDFKPQRYPNVRDNVRVYPDRDGNLTVELAPGSYRVWLCSSHVMQGKTSMGIGVGAGAKLAIDLNAAR